MLQADLQGKLLIGGMHIRLHILIETVGTEYGPDTNQ
jgi:hypothetical protein